MMEKYTGDVVIYKNQLFKIVLQDKRWGVIFVSNSMKTL